MNEDYVSYELAVKLKECGFDEPCIAQWACEPDGKPMLVGSTAFVFSNAELKGRDVTAPLLYHAQKWLREKHKWHIVIEPRIWEQQVYDYKLWSFMRGYENANRGLDYLSYEQALSAGITAALELINKGE